ncbi:hypothetical protein V6N13_108455 [Hibiscus sabdariffa]
MTSSHHAPYALGDTRATMDGTKGHDPARVPPVWRHRGVKRKERDGVSLAFGIAGPNGRPARRAISSVVERAPDNCVVVSGLHISMAYFSCSNRGLTWGGASLSLLLSRRGNRVRISRSGGTPPKSKGELPHLSPRDMTRYLNRLKESEEAATPP